MKETNHRLGIFCMGFLLAIVVLLIGRTITGYYIQATAAEATVINAIIGILVAAMFCVFAYYNRNNLKKFAMNVLSTFAILTGLFVLFTYVQDIELISALISLTFGIWAIIWTLNARSVLSKGSSIRNYTTGFFFCLVFVLLFSIWDAVVNMFALQGLWLHIKYIIIIFVYTTFVFTAYRVYRIGKEFGFSEKSAKIKRIMKEQKKGKPLRNYLK